MSEASAVESLLFAALDKPTADERAAFLDSACAGDADLRRQVEKLLKAHANVGAFLQKPVVEHLAVIPEPADATQEIAGSTDGPDAVRTGGTGVYLERTEGGAASDSGGSLDFLQPATRPDSLGRLGHYEVLEVLGKGGFGVVFRAFDDKLQRVVAIKVLSAEMSATTAARKRFLREARSSAKVRHDNVVQVYGVQEQPLPYLVMEYVPGETLQQRSDRTGPMEVTDVVRIGRQIAEGLAAAHAQGLIHRDIKPGNILIEAGPNDQVKITDFGLARAADDASLSQSGTIAGTPMYMSPEQASADNLDHRADLFSLGSVLYTMCTGHPPFRAPSTLAVLKRVVEDTPRPIREITPETPAWLCDLIAKLHAKKPDDRFATGREVADLLGRGLVALQSHGRVKPHSIAVPTVVPIARRAQETPEAAPTLKPRLGIRRWLVAAAVLLTLLGGLTVTEATGVTKLRSTVIRLFSPDGTLVVEIDDPDVSVQIDGSEIIIRGAGVKEIRLKPGSYTVKGIKDGQVVSRELVTVTKDGKQIVRISQEAKPAGDRTQSGTETTNPDRRAAEYVLSLGGMVKVNEQNKWIKTASELPREAFRLKFASLVDKSVTAAGLTAFKDCKNLKELELRYTNVTDEGLANFKDYKGLTLLYLTGPSVTDAGLAHFKDCKNLTYLRLENTSITDAGLTHFKSCKDLKWLYLNRNAVGDTGLAAFQDCKELRTLELLNTQVSDAGLAHFKDCKELASLNLNGTPVSGAGLVHFKDCKNLGGLQLTGTQVTNAALAAMKDCKNLTELRLQDTQVSDAGLAHLADCKNLMSLRLGKTKVTAAGIDELKKALPKCKIEWDGGVVEPKVGSAAFTDADVQRIAALPAAEQVEEIRAELTRRNPEFRGRLIPTIKDGVVTGLKSQDTKRSIADLSPLRGMKLTELNLINHSQVADLTPLRGMPLERLSLWPFLGSDLTPLQGMPLKILNIGGGRQKLDLTPLAGMPLEILCINSSQVSDLTPLKGMLLKNLACSNTLVADLDPLRGMPLNFLHITNCKVSDLAPIQGMPLGRMDIDGTSVTELSPLKGMPLKDIRLTPKNITQGLDILRDMKSLKTIGTDYDKAWPAAEFWERYDKGEFTK